MTPHLRGHVRAYVDRALPPALLHVYDRHLVCCAMCRAAADQERRIVASLRSDTFVPGSLRSSLMGLAQSPPPQPADAGPRIPLGPLAPLAARAAGERSTGEPAAIRREPVPTVLPTAPAMHRSPMRAAVVASLAAGASVAAAWGLAVTPLPGGTRTPLARVPAGVASLGTSPFAPASFLTNRFPGSSATTSQVVGPVATPTPSRASAFLRDVPVRISLVLSAESSP